MTITNCQAVDAGSYHAVVSNPHGALGSADAVLTVVETRPKAVVTPKTALVEEGCAVEFRCAAVGSEPILYEWLWRGRAIPGATNGTFTISNVTAANAGMYRVIASNPLGASRGAAKLAVATRVAITKQPVGQLLKPDGKGKFSVKANGSGPLFFQWFREGTPVPGETNAALVVSHVSPAQEGMYHVIVSNWFSRAESSAVVLELLRAPVITEQPAGQTVPVGGTAHFSVEARGSEPLRYQWQFNGRPVAGAKAATLLLEGLTEQRGGVYRVLVSNAAGRVLSENATLTVSAEVIAVAGSVAQPPPTVAHAVRLAVMPTEGGGVRLRMIGEPGRIVEIEESTDLVTWRRMKAETNASGVFEFTTTPGAVSRFFRAVTR